MAVYPLICRLFGIEARYSSMRCLNEFTIPSDMFWISVGNTLNSLWRLTPKLCPIFWKIFKARKFIPGTPQFHLLGAR